MTDGRASWVDQALREHEEHAAAEHAAAEHAAAEHGAAGHAGRRVPAGRAGRHPVRS